MTFNETIHGYQSARSQVELSGLNNTPELPFNVISKDEFLTKFNMLEKSMRTENVSLEEGYRLLLEENLPWRLSPETKIARLYAEDAQVGKFITAQENKDQDAWRQLTPIHHEASAKKANVIWQERKKEMKMCLDSWEANNPNNDASPTSKNLAIKYLQNKNKIDELASKISLDKKKSLELSLSDAVDEIIGKPFIKNKTNLLKTGKAYHHGKRLSDRAKLADELVKRNQAIAQELPNSSFSIGAINSSGQRVFFDMQVIRNISINAASGKETSFLQGLIIQEPGWTDTQRKNRPVGLAILPWYEAYRQAPSGEVYINIGLRNEPGADNYSTSVTGEQTSGSKIENGDILKQQGGAFIAVCVGEKLAVHCEQIPELTEAVPEMDAALASRDGNRMGGGHNAYAAIKIEDGSPLLLQYAKQNSWIKLTDLEELIDENNEDRPIVNDLLLAAKDQLNRRLRNQAEIRDKAKSELLKDIATNPSSRLGFMIGGFVNDLEKIIAKLS
jgi:hypothetical protein